VEAFKIAITCIAAAILYGIIHDQITARICVEYFTMFPSTDLSHPIANLAWHRMGHHRDLVGRSVLLDSNDPCGSRWFAPRVARF
jgi:hypothetical protein